MITLASFNWGSGPKIPVTLAYEHQRSGADMQYRVQVIVGELTTSSSYFGYPIYLKLTMDGTLRETTTLKATSPSQWSSAITYTSPWYTVSNKTSGTTVVSFNLYSGSGSTRNDTYSYSMAVDPAASKLAAPGGTLGTSLDLIVTKYNTSFTHSISYVCGTAKGDVCTKSSATSVTWNANNGNTVALAAQNTTGQSVKVTFTIITYSGTTEVGRNTDTCTMTIPSTVKPSVSLTVADAAGYLATYGAYVQGKSKLTITATPTLAYSSPIKTYAITADGKTYTTSPVTTDVLNNKGSLEVTAKVTDSRTYSSEVASTKITVLEYAPPAVTVTAYRCNSSGTADQEGAYMKFGFTATISSLNSKNSATYSISYKGDSGTATTLTGSGLTYTSDKIACDVSKIWTIEVKVTDKLSTTTKAAVIPIAFTLMDFYSTGKGVAFGKVGTRDGFDCAMAAYFSGATSVSGALTSSGGATFSGALTATGTTAMPSGMTVGGKTLLNLIYPVGSIYMSVSSTSPATFLGGTWVQIKDTFLLAAGTTYAAGATGGEATHKLVRDEMPSHNHFLVDTGNTQYVYTSSKSASTSGSWGARLTANYGTMDVSTETYKLTTSGSGSDGAHNNMPPYLAVYVWKRTA